MSTALEQIRASLEALAGLAARVSADHAEEIAAIGRASCRERVVRVV